MSYGAYSGEFSIAPGGEPAAVIDYGTELDPDFLAAFGPPAMLTLPIDLEKRAYDFSYNGNTGTLNGGVTTSGSGVGVLGQSWKFDGSTGIISTAYTGSLGTQARTTWAVISTTANSNPKQAILAYGTPNSPLGAGWGFYESVGKFRLGVNGFVQTSAAINDGKPHLLVAVWSTSLGTNVTDARLYIDGVLAPTDTSSSATINTIQMDSLQLGYNLTGDTGAVPYGGKIYASGEFQVALTAAQVSNLYSSLLYGEPYRLFDQTANERFIVNVASGGLLLARRRDAAA